MTERRVHLDDLGAWLIKGNADAVDLAARFAREPRVTSWCVRPGYRARLMRAAQPVVFWASAAAAAGGQPVVPDRGPVRRPGHPPTTPRAVPARAAASGGRLGG